MYWENVNNVNYILTEENKAGRMRHFFHYYYYCTRGPFPGRKRPGLEADHSTHLVPRSENKRSYTSTPQYVFMALCSAKSTGTASPLPLLLLNWYTLNRNRSSSVRIMTRLWVGRPEFDNSQGQLRDVFSSPPRPDQLWGPPSLLSNGYRCYLTWSKAIGACSWPLTSM
jgi:hypothetical protein